MPIKKEETLGIVTPVGAEKEDLADFIALVLKNAEKFFSEIRYFLVTDKITSSLAREIIGSLAKKDKRIIELYHPENKNLVEAYVKGYNKAVAGCDYILEIDAGFSHDPNQIKDFLQAINDKDGRIDCAIDCALGIRFSDKAATYKADLRRFILSYGGTKLINFFLGTKLPDMTSGYSLYSKECLEHVLSKGIYSEGAFFQSEMRFHVRNHRKVLVPITYKSSTVSGRMFSYVYDSFKNLFRLFLKERLLKK